MKKFQEIQDFWIQDKEMLRNNQDKKNEISYLENQDKKSCLDETIKFIGPKFLFFLFLFFF